MSSIVKFQRSADPYEHILRAVLQDKKLSIDTLGALCRLLSLPGDWEWQCWHLEKEVLRVGRDKRKRIFKELIEAGYLIISKSPNGPDGGWQHTYILSNSSQKLNEFSGDVKPVDAKPTTAKDVDKHNTELENTELENTQPQQPAAEAAAGSSGLLIFDKSINQNLHQKLAGLLADVDSNLAQKMLDVLVSMENKARFPLKLMKSFVANQDDFDPTPGFPIARKRENERLAAEKRKLESEQKNRPFKNPAAGKKKLVDLLKEKNLEGALPPLQTALQEGEAKRMCAKRT